MRNNNIQVYAGNLPEAVYKDLQQHKIHTISFTFRDQEAFNLIGEGDLNPNALREAREGLRRISLESAIEFYKGNLVMADDGINLAEKNGQQHGVMVNSQETIDDNVLWLADFNVRNDTLVPQSHCSLGKFKGYVNIEFMSYIQR